MIHQAPCRCELVRPRTYGLLAMMLNDDLVWYNIWYTCQYQYTSPRADIPCDYLVLRISCHDVTHENLVSLSKGKWNTAGSLSFNFHDVWLIDLHIFTYFDNWKSQVAVGEWVRALPFLQLCQWYPVIVCLLPEASFHTQMLLVIIGYLWPLHISSPWDLLQGEDVFSSPLCTAKVPLGVAYDQNFPANGQR